MYLVVWPYSDLWPALTGLGSSRSLLAPGFDRFWLNKLEYAIKTFSPRGAARSVGLKASRLPIGKSCFSRATVGSISIESISALM
jgi:hypothetical protein